MKRRSELRLERQKSKQRKLLIIGGLLVATLVLASAFLVGSGAVFTSTSANPGNMFTAGILTNSNNGNGIAILTADHMKPGDTASGDVTISNGGNISGKFSLVGSKVSSTPGLFAGDLYNGLDLTITEGAVTIYTGTLANFNAVTAVTPQTLGTWAAGAIHKYHFVVTFHDNGTPSGNGLDDNSYMGAATTVRFDWTAVQ